MPEQLTFRAGLVGAGYISEYHVRAIRRLTDVELVGVSDMDFAKAEQLASRFSTKAYRSPRELREAGANTIHILTPPHTHASLAIEALNLGCHVLVEKPLAVDIAECEAIRTAAARQNLKVCVNHSLLFDPQIRQALDKVCRGGLGRIVSVDILRSSVYPSYAGGPLPPHLRNAGYPFRDLGVHALYLLQAFLGPIQEVTADWRSLGGDPNLAFDEWRALVRCRDGLGQVQLSWNVKPLQSQVIIQGTRGVLRVDLFLMSQALRRSLPVPKAAERVINAVSDSLPLLVDTPRNIYRVLSKKILPYHGLQDLVKNFYAALSNGEPMPVTVDDAIPVLDWVEKVARGADEDHEARVQRAEKLRPLANSAAECILVTGASGSIGGSVARALLAQGRRVRMLMRREPDTIPEGAEIVLGNLGDPEAVERAVKGADIVIHAGAAMKGNWDDHLCATVAGTKNVLEACHRFQVKKLVYLSSMSVLQWAGANQDAVLDEMSPLETQPDNRGFYTSAKFQAELMVKKYVEEQKIPTVILRPGKVFGPNSPLLSPAIGWKIKSRWLLLGDGNVRLPLVYIDDVVDAVLAAMESPLESGEVIQITDPNDVTQNDVLRAMEGHDVKCLRIPRWLVFRLGAVSEMLLKPLKRKSPVSVYRLKSALALRKFASQYAERVLGWRPKVGVWEGIAREARGFPAVSESQVVVHDEDSTAAVRNETVDVS